MKGALHGDKVEVTEVFSFGCPACNAAYPHIDKLKKDLPPNAVMTPPPSISACTPVSSVASATTSAQAGCRSCEGLPGQAAKHRCFEGVDG